MTTATATTEVRDELVERIDEADARVRNICDTSVLAHNDVNEYIRLSSKILALRKAKETIQKRVQTDDETQFNAALEDIFKAYRESTEAEHTPKTDGARGGYSLAIDYMRYSIGQLG